MDSATNTLILCDIDREHFSAWKEATHDVLSGLEKWVELPSFHRVLMIFDSSVDAFNALQFLKGQFADLHLFFGPDMSLDARPTYLSLPDAGKLYFTSPPASPPGEWEQTTEEPPNKVAHHDDEFNDQLNLALLKYKSQLEQEEPSQEPEVCVLHAGDENIPSLQVTFEGDPLKSVSIPKTRMPDTLDPC